MKAYVTLQYKACRVDIHEVEYKNPAELAELTPDAVQKFPTIASSGWFDNENKPISITEIKPTMEPEILDVEIP